MKNTYTRRIYPTGLFFILFILMLGTTNPVKAQLGDIGDIFEGGKDDANLLAREYLKPFGSGFGAGINSGWVDRANTHGVLGFHFKLSVSAALVPEVDRQFNVEELGLQELQVISGAPTTPTFSGTSSSGNTARLGIEHDFNGETRRIADFRMPPGVGLNFVPTPMIQAGAGLPKNTDIMFRVIPKVSFSDYGDIYLYGFGFKHEINQWLPGGRFWPVTLSVMAGGTRFGSSAALDARPSGSFEDPDNYGGSQSSTWNDQEITFTTDAYTINLLVGKSIPFVAVYGGVGFESSSTAVNVNGNFPYYTPNENYTSGGGQSDRILNVMADPIDFSISGANSFRALAGLRISLPFVALNVDYTLAEYHLLTAGFGVSFR